MPVAQDGLTVPSLQYGAFAICVVLAGICLVLIKVLMDQVKAAREERDRLGKTIGEKDAQILELVTRNIAAYNRLTEALLSKPCLAGDRSLHKPFAKEQEL